MKGITFYKENREPTPDNPNEIINTMVNDEVTDYIYRLEQENKQLKEEIARLKEQINIYENPDDLTLMFMWCDEKAKDKIKDLQEKIAKLKGLCDKYEDEHRTTFEIWKNDIQKIDRAIEILNLLFLMFVLLFYLLLFHHTT